MTPPNPATTLGAQEPAPTYRETQEMKRRRRTIFCEQCRVTHRIPKSTEPPEEKLRKESERAND
jgi:hypothetical protein